MSNVPMTLPRRVVPAQQLVSPVRRKRLTDLLQRESVIIFVASATVYLIVAGLMVNRNIIFTDATSRVANAFYVLFSRDPHLPAMGFVWNPLPSFVLLPILPFKSLFPGLVVYGAAGAIQSALSMAGAAAGIGVCLRKLGASRAPRLVLVVLFAGQPMIALYAGSGQSEPMLILFLVLVASSLISWMQSARTGHLVGAGVFLGLGYLTRYEAGATAAGVMALVAVVSVARSRGSRQFRLRLALNDVVLVGVPFLFSFVLWAAAARILVGEWFPTFGSKYGNSAQVQSAAHWIQEATGTTTGQTLWYLSKQISALAPLLALLLVAAAVLAVRRRNPAVLVPVVVFGSVMAFCGLVLLVGSSFGWLRFQITAIPMTTLLAGAVIGMLAPATGSAHTAVTGRVGRAAGGRLRAGATVAALLAVAVSWPVQATVLTDPSLNLAREEAPILSDVFTPDRPGNDLRLLQMFQVERSIATYLDQLRPGDGTVLADSAYAFPIIMSSAHPHTFVISSDFDFQAAVENPLANHIRYILVRSDARSDAVQVQWPTLYADGNSISTLVRNWVGVVGEWRLYRVTGSADD